MKQISKVEGKVFLNRNIDGKTPSITIGSDEIAISEGGKTLYSVLTPLVKYFYWQLTNSAILLIVLVNNK